MEPDTPSSTHNREAHNREAMLASRNKRLAEALKSARDKLQVLAEQIAELAEPASTYGVFLEAGEHYREAEITTQGRRMRVKVSPTVPMHQLKAGMRVRLGEGSIIVEACGYDSTGQLAQITERLGKSRAVVSLRSGDEQVVELAAPIVEGVRSGDAVLVDIKAGVAIEVVEHTEVSQLTLEEIPNITWDDIGGLDNQIEQIRDAIELPFEHPDLYQKYNLSPPKGILLYGPPGSGKTLIAKAIAKQLGEDSEAHFLNVKGPELLNKYVGETERLIRLVFERARDIASGGQPVVIFFDEMESIFRTRGSGVSSDMETTVVPQLLTELDGVESLNNVIVIGATNREELIDPAILRPGRLDLKVCIDRPNRAGARDIASLYINDSLPLSAPAEELVEATIDQLFADRPYVRLTLVDGRRLILHYRDFISGAMIANVVNRAKKMAIKNDLLAGYQVGLTATQLREAVMLEQEQSEDLPNTSDPEGWARISGVRGSRILNVEVLD